MSWSYDVTSLAVSLKDQVRLILGDTDTDDQLLQDEEISFYLSQQADNVKAAAILCCDAIAAKAIKDNDFSLGPYSVRMSKRADSFKALAASLKQSIAGVGTPYMYTPHDAIFDLGMMNASQVTED